MTQAVKEKKKTIIKFKWLFCKYNKIYPEINNIYVMKQIHIYCLLKIASFVYLKIQIYKIYKH